MDKSEDLSPGHNISDNSERLTLTNLGISKNSGKIMLFYFCSSHAKPDAVQVTFPHPVATPSEKHGFLQPSWCRQKERDGEGVPALNCLS